MNNLSNALIFNTNGTVYGSTNIADNDGNINITLPPGNASYVLDNFNLTEGVTRENSPLWFSSSSDTSKHIASNLTDTVNITVVINVSDCDINRIVYTSHTGIYSAVYTSDGSRGADYSWTSCSDGILQLEIYGVEQASGSNVISMEYDDNLDPYCDNFQEGLGRFGAYFALIILAIVVTFFIGTFSNQDGGKGVRDLILAGIVSLTVGGVFIIVGLIMIESIC